MRTPLNAVIGFSDMLMNEERMRLDVRAARNTPSLSTIPVRICSRSSTAS